VGRRGRGHKVPQVLWREGSAERGPSAVPRRRRWLWTTSSRPWGLPSTQDVSLCPSAALALADWYSVSVFQRAGFTQSEAGCCRHLLAIGARRNCDGIDLPAWPVAVRGL